MVVPDVPPVAVLRVYLPCYNKRNPKKGIERSASSSASPTAASPVTTKEIPKRELRGPRVTSRSSTPASGASVTTKEIPKRELRVVYPPIPPLLKGGSVTTKEIPKRELRV
jgi:hypothetical protein